MSRHRQPRAPGEISYAKRGEGLAAVSYGASLRRVFGVRAKGVTLVGPGLIGQRVRWLDRPSAGVWIIYDAMLSEDPSEGFLYCIEKPGGTNKKCWLDEFSLELV